MNIGFIGLGIMGLPMAANLIRRGHTLTCFDAVPERALASGGRPCSSIRETVQSADFVITMLPDSPQVLDVILGADGVAECARAGTLVIDMSSISPVASAEIWRTLAGRGLGFLDAPVSGGEPKAVDGTLSIMVGGDEKDFSQAEPVLKCMGASVIRVGGAGAGNTVKLANQIIVALNIAAVSEALLLTEKAGVDPYVMLDAIRGGLAGSAVLNAKTPMMIEGDFRPGFKIDLHLKDLNNALDMAGAVGAELLLTPHIRQILKALSLGGLGGTDHSAIFQYYQKSAGHGLYGHHDTDINEVQTK